MSNSSDLFVSLYCQSEPNEKVFDDATQAIKSLSVAIDTIVHAAVLTSGVLQLSESKLQQNYNLDILFIQALDVRMTHLK